MIGVLNLCRQRERIRSLEWKQEVLLEWMVNGLLAHPHCLGLSLWSLLHDLALLMNPPWQEQCLLLANVEVILLVIHQQTLKHLVGFLFAGDLPHLAIDAHTER